MYLKNLTFLLYRKGGQDVVTAASLQLTYIKYKSLRTHKEVVKICLTGKKGNSSSSLENSGNNEQE